MTTSSHLCVALLFLTWGFPYLETFSLCSANTDVRCIESEREALLQFKRSLNDSMGRLSSWDGEECCTWTGISCSNKTQHVVKLNLSAAAAGFADDDDDDGYQFSDTELQLGGEINSSLVNLKHLQYLDLSYNNFNGIRIPTFIGSLQKLKYLDLSRACFGGSVPPHLGNLSSLHHLNLFTDFCPGGFDVELKVDNLHWLRGLSSLRYLNMGYVNLSTEAMDWVQHISMLPLLSELRLHSCGLSSLPLSHSFSNLTSLTVLDLSFNWIRIPTFIGSLEKLKYLDLSMNNFDSSMPQWLFNLTNLETLYLVDSFILGPIPDSFTNMTSLQILDLYMNDIDGHLPTSLGTLCNLQKLHLSSNNITGPITELVEGLSACSTNRLRYLYLSNNNMSGMIPKGLGKLSELVRLDLSGNHWEGVLSEAHFHNLTNLHWLRFSSSSTSLSLNVSSSWIPPFSRITDLGFGNCQVGPKFPSWIRFQKHLEILYLRNTGISDNMPDWIIQNLTSLFLLDLSHNKIRGSFSLQISYESGNKTSSTSSSHQPIPNSFSSLTHAILGNNLFSGVIPFNIDEIMPYVVVLDLSMNSIHGEIPSSICMLHNLRTLTLSSNHILGKIPPCYWKRLEYLSLENNNLTGEIPNEIGFSPSLAYLKLNNNNLHGKVPLSLQHLKRVTILDLGENNFSGELLMWMGEGFLSLIVLRLRSNVFTGYIPLQLCSFSSLQILDLGDNKLSGPIPSCFGNLSAMARVEVNGSTSLLGMYFGINNNDFAIEANTKVVKGRYLDYTKNLVLLASLDLSNNHLSGEIPSELTRLQDLQILNLSMNNLTGLVPKQIGHMKQLEALDLSTNQLNGTIPPSISDLNFLSLLNLSNNNLSGRIPSGNQLNTLNDSSVYKGNSQLCGPPLTSKCPGDSVTPSPVFVVGDEEDESKTELLYFYVGIASGFVFGFCGVCATLVLKESWRRAYFQFIWDMRDWMFVIIAVRIACLRRT